MEPNNIKDWIKRKKDQRERMNPETLFDGILKGDLSSLSSGITLIESQDKDQRYAADGLIQKCLPYSGKSIRVGITGVPGVGKSTFIEAFGMLLIRGGFKVAVLAIDPSSSVSGGSILGDKTRMNELSAQDSVFIRPSPARYTLGGVARKTRESILLCEAAGYDFILVETVGVGQSETVVKSMVDFFLLLMLSGAGDELQGIKKGIMEMADALVITKADGDNKLRAKLAAREYKNALHLFPSNKNNWIPKVFTCSALEKKNITNVLDVIEDFRSHVMSSGFFETNRKSQDNKWLSETLKELIINDFFLDGQMIIHLKEIEQKVINGEKTSFQAADELYKIYTNARRV
ncbi:MAG: methylmalonyl Co-A mutase-associated GTPase MeaB [Crocinitomicaceae bacterium]